MASKMKLKELELTKEREKIHELEERVKKNEEKEKQREVEA